MSKKKIIRVTCETKEMLPIDSFRPFQGNLKTITKEAQKKIRESFVRHGISFPVFYWETNGIRYTIDGHQRLPELARMIKDDGYVIEGEGNKVPAVRVNAKDQKHAKELILVAASHYGTISSRTLNEFLEEAAIDLSGISSTVELRELDIRMFIKELEATQRRDLNEVPDPPVRARTKPGDLYEVGDHRIYCGDTTKEESYEAVGLKDVKAKLVVTSPPYGVGKEYEKPGIEPWIELMETAIVRIVDHAEVVGWNIGDLYTTGGQFTEPTGSYSVQIFMRHGMRPLWWRIWLKPGVNMSSSYQTVTSKPAQQFEHLIVMGKDLGSVPKEFDLAEFEHVLAFSRSNYKHVKRLAREDRRSWGYAGVWEMNTVAKHKEHPAMFPVELPSRMIRMHTDEGDTVLDPFGGSGTTMLACEILGRKGRMIEREPRYVDVAVQRLVDARNSDEITLNGRRTRWKSTRGTSGSRRRSAGTVKPRSSSG